MHALPAVDDLLRLGTLQPVALSVYLPTEPGPAGRTAAMSAVKSAVDQTIAALRAEGHPRAERESLRAQWTALSQDAELWGNLDRSLAVFLAPDSSEEYVVPTVLEPRTSYGSRFDLAPLLRATTTPQEAYALTLSSAGWKLWQARDSTRIDEFEFVGNHEGDAPDAIDRMSPRARSLLRGFGCKNGEDVLLERYAHIVADAIRTELGRTDPSASVPLFVFAANPLASMILSQNLPWTIELIRGAPDGLGPDELGQAIRERITALNSAELNRRAKEMGDKFKQGLSSLDTAQVARAAVAGAVGTFFHAIDSDVRGALDETTGEIHLSADGDDLLTAIALAVLRKGGEVRAVRPDVIRTQLWNGTILACLRHQPGLIARGDRLVRIPPHFWGLPLATEAF